MRAAARGETTIGVTFLHDGVTEIANGFPMKIVVPCEGTGYEVGSMSIVKGARNPANARRFYDWALTPAAQKIGGDTRNFQCLSNSDADSRPARRMPTSSGSSATTSSSTRRRGGAPAPAREMGREVYALPR